MKTYSGEPGPPAAIYVQSGRAKPKKLTTKVSVGFGWGKVAAGSPLDHPGSLATAQAILGDVLAREPARAGRHASRFKHRVVSNWNATAGWSISEEEVRAVITDIEKVERETSQTRRMVSQEPAPVASEGGGDVTWTKRPQMTQNHQRRKP